MKTAAKRWIRRIALSGLVALLLFIAWFVYGIANTLRGLPDAYAKWDVGDMIIDYLTTHPGKWPAEWDDLRPSFEKLKFNRESGSGYMRGGLTFNDIRSRIGIDWTAQPAELAKAEPNDNEPPFRVIWPLDGNSTTWAGAEPNEMVLEYLRNGPPGGEAFSTATAPSADSAKAPGAVH